MSPASSWRWRSVGKRRHAPGGCCRPSMFWVMFAQPHLIYDRLDLGLLLFFLLLDPLLAQLAGVTAWADGWAAASYLVLGLGISFKIMPVVFAPFLLLADWRTCQRRSTVAGRFLLLLLGAVGPFLAQALSAGWGVLELFRYHGQRDPSGIDLGECGPGGSPVRPAVPGRLFARRLQPVESLERRA